jgi:hypothetical protein
VLKQWFVDRVQAAPLQRDLHVEINAFDRITAYSIFCGGSSVHHVIFFGFRTRVVMNTRRGIGIYNLYLIYILLIFCLSNAVAPSPSVLSGYCISVCTCIHCSTFILFSVHYLFRLRLYELLSYGISYICQSFSFSPLFLYVQINWCNILLRTCAI